MSFEPRSNQRRVPRPHTNRSRLIEDLRILAADAMRGREAGTADAAKARHFIRDRFSHIGIAPLFPGYEQPFVFRAGEHDEPRQGMNVIGLLRGQRAPDEYIIVSAHYDHLGTNHEGVYNGADDNASGVATLLYVARAFAKRPPHTTIIFCAFDAEEVGMCGSEAFVRRAPIPLERIVACVNVDMVGRAPDDTLWIAGTHPYPHLKPFAERAARLSSVPVRYGHDRFSFKPGHNWTHESDQGPFADRDVPWLFVGTVNDSSTHDPSDTAEGIDEAFLANAARVTLEIVRLIDGDKGR